MGISLIAAVAVMAVMTGFMVLAIKQAAASFHRQLKEDAIRAMGAYDFLLEEKSRQLRELNRSLREEKKKQKELTVLPMVTKPMEQKVEFSPVSGIGMMAEASWRSRDFAQTHRMVSRAFSMDYDEIIKTVMKQKKALVSQPAKELLEELSFDTFCSLSVLSGKEQERILRESVGSQALALLEQYQSTVPSFESIGFYSYLKEMARDHTNEIIIRHSEGVTISHLPDGVKEEISDAICEGIQIVMDGVLYDYSISEREIS